MSDSNADQSASASAQPPQDEGDAQTQLQQSNDDDAQQEQQSQQQQQADEQQQQQDTQQQEQQQAQGDDGQQAQDSHSLAMQQQQHAMQAMMMGASPMQHFDIDEFEAQQQMLHAHLSGAAVGAHPMQLLQAQREQDQINQQANGMMPQQGGGNMGGIEICRAYLAGRCSRGAACRFVHVENSGGHAPPNPHLCRDWLNGTCQRGAGCRFQHQGLSGSKASIHAGASKAGPWSMKHSVICHQWASRGRCDYGTACKFSHQRGEKWNESALDEKKLLAAMLSGLSPQEALSQALNSLQASNPSKFGPMDPNAVNGVQAAALNGNNANSPNGAPVGPNGLVPQMDGSGMPNPQQMNGMPPLGPQKRADGSLILCRFYARHGYCKYGVACKFAHAPSLNGAGVFPQVGPNGMVMPGYGDRGSPQQGANGQSLASLLALGLKASMMSQESLIANHAALLAANAMNGGQANGQGVGVPRVNSPSAMQNGQLPPMDPALASVISAYLQGQQPAMPQQGLATLLQQLQGGGNGAANSGNPNSLSPTAQLGYGGFAPDSASSDAFQAFMQQQQQQNAFNNAFSPAAASAFNAIPNTNTAAANGGANAGNASGAGASGSSSGANGSGSNGNNGSLSLPQMISTAFRSSSNGSSASGGSSGQGSNANGSANGNASSLSNNLSLMSLKPFSDDDAAAYTNDNNAQEVHGRSNSSSFNDASSSFSSPSLLAADARSPDNFGNYSSAGTSNTNNTIIGGGMGNGTLSALFSSSLNGPFLH